MIDFSLLTTILLVAAINTLIISIAVHIIFKIKNKKGKEVKNHFRIEKIPQKEDEISLSKEVNHQKEELNIKQQIPKENMTEETTEVKPKFLKYTSAGYIVPDKDHEIETLKWR